MKLTSRERIMRIFKNEEIDRPALKLWGAGFPDSPQLNPAYQPVSDLAYEVSDLFIGSGSPFNIYGGMDYSGFAETWREDTTHPTWKDEHTVFHTPKGDLHMINRVSTVGEPDYTIEYMVKEPEDLEALMSLPYTPFPVSTKDYETKNAKLGDRGIVMTNIDHAGYALHRMMGSETLAYFSVDEREMLINAIEMYSDRLYDHIKKILDAGVTAPVGWVGPELFIPPLMGPQDFRDFVYRFDKRICDLVHDRGSYVWMHCHGKVANFVEDYINMGIDVLNPLEPPKNGDIDMARITEKYKNRIGWEGNIEIQDLLQSSPERVRMLIDECVEKGKDSGRFILCPSAGYMEYPFPEQRYIDNLLLYLRHGLKAVERAAY